MTSFDNPIANTKTNPIVSAIAVFFIALFAFQIIGPFIGFIFAMPFYEGGLMEFAEMVTSGVITNEIKVPLYILQGVSSAFGLIVVPIIYIRLVERKSSSNFFWFHEKTSLQSILTILIGLTFMVFVGMFVYWNANLQLPEFLSSFEQSARAMEDKLMEMTKALTTFDTTGQFVLALVVVAIIPSIGEEIVFRGLIQNFLLKGTKNIHLAIFISAFFFSAMHMQFYGLVPRMLLGMLFGYLYYYSGNLFIPMLAHFVNNGFTIIMMFLYQQQISEMDLESADRPELLPWLIFSTICFALLFYFKKLSAVPRNYE